VVLNPNGEQGAKLAQRVVRGGGVASEKIGPVMILIQIWRVQGAVDWNQVGEPKMN
jgi:hypothetical protein